jgi:hypothetical protein
MPFYRTTVEILRPWSGLTPLGITKVTIEAETEASSQSEACEVAKDNADKLVQLDHVTGYNVEAR